MASLLRTKVEGKEAEIPIGVFVRLRSSVKGSDNAIESPQTSADSRKEHGLMNYK